MALKVLCETAKKDTKQDLCLGLEQYNEKSVAIVALDSKGKRITGGMLFRITEDGLIKFCQSINESAPPIRDNLQLDETRTIKESNT